MIARISISSWTGEWKALTQEQWLELRELIPGDEPEKKPEYGTRDFVADDEIFRLLAKYKLGITFSENDSRETSMYVKLQDRIRELEMTHRSDPELIQAGAMVQITIPDLGLLYIDQVTYLDDCCTDNLQTYLDEGWRLLAVCPPNARRRPDYILGRRKKDAS